ncbi:helix-turn-helix domain-containing protein [Lentzea flaviverrucosa]|uniref:Helix-turn-helix domain-containing protein n=1 Tax=Lentzea flaviverrucosa TaxID=200379 RepID=A0A1H9SS76_9PSEU|nr:helix-turn-helix transcriptional regulator [Lentzea flaviverrucosa]RDI25497.1 helix-turn-helix protein [Lentzea flaviverrucosa]SER87724.1 Helix-turn-helix domain-containing protein [Lentzea flaviverrucosa]
MPKDFRATTLERAIGRQLAGWRDERELSLTEAGRRVGFSSAKLSMMENAVQPSAPVDVMALGYVYQVPTPEWQAVVLRAQYAEQVRTRSVNNGPHFDPAADFVNLVFEATSLRVFTTDLVPPVFQLPGYANAVLQSDDPVRTARLALVREAWSARLNDRDPLRVRAVFPEAVLRHVIGGPRVMKAQLLHLMEVSEHETVSVQVVPRDAGAYPAMGSPFTLLGFPHRQHNDVAYLETFIKGEYVEEAGLTEECAQRFAGLRKIALGEGESLELIAEAAADL